MEALEVSGKTVDEAIQTALEQLGLTTTAEVNIEIVQEAKRSILGLGGENAIVRVTPLTSSETSSWQNFPSAESDTTTGTAREVLEKLLSMVEVEGTVEVIPSEDEKTPAMLNITTSNPGILIGRRGQALSALQYMVNFLASRRLKSSVKVLVDVADYRKRRREELQNMALRIADLVRTNQRSITMEPMGAWERRIVHLTLREEEGITTGSTGYGERRKVVVSLTK
ncbi:MAG: RNA-binding cell elongation regulator Jag/EloR [Dehalococcoidia bacterium]